ncbi:RHS repeat-associated core domain-containing protein [uncultured Cohaesibacter sp.]|uniref:RHS repeat-associated core domain-containing protein n=1 Tax=uncultured Cohaesibacter sp. TaxID=1002546 RepID=UPI00292EDA6C|nr:RHS repeat-associated core domain-containing protein [uncultured Cohaesibacter sp.]
MMFTDMVLSESKPSEILPHFFGEGLPDFEGPSYFNARWYDADTARFITEDPARDGLLWYAYCKNNPMNFVDPTGLDDIKIGLQGSLAWGTNRNLDGSNWGIGVVIDLDNIKESGTYIEGGESHGGGLSFSLGISYTSGEAEGDSVNLGLDLPLAGGAGIAGNISYADDGATGFGLGLTLGGGYTYEETSTVTLTVEKMYSPLVDIIKDLDDAYCELFANLKEQLENTIQKQEPDKELPDRSIPKLDRLEAPDRDSNTRNTDNESNSSNDNNDQTADDSQTQEEPSDEDYWW